MQINIGSEPGHKMPIFLGCYFLGVFSSVVVTLIWDFGGGGNFWVVGDGGAAVLGSTHVVKQLSFSMLP